MKQRLNIILLLLLCLITNHSFTANIPEYKPEDIEKCTVALYNYLKMRYTDKNKAAAIKESVDLFLKTGIFLDPTEELREPLNGHHWEMGVGIMYYENLNNSEDKKS